MIWYSLMNNRFFVEFDQKEGKGDSETTSSSGEVGSESTGSVNDGDVEATAPAAAAAEHDDGRPSVHIPVQPRQEKWQDKASEPRLSKHQKKQQVAKSKLEAAKNENREKRRLANLAVQLAQQGQADKVKLKPDEVETLLATAPV
jgi:hypothetical protein